MNFTKKRKRLHIGAKKPTGKSRFCLVLSLGHGIKAQYPVESQQEAIALYSHYTALHPNLNLQPSLVANTGPVF